MGLSTRLVTTVIQIIGSILIVVILILAIQSIRPNPHPVSSIVPAAYPPPPTPGVTATSAPYPAPLIGQAANIPLDGDALQEEYRLKITPTIPSVADDGWYVFSAPDVGYSFHYPTDSHLSSGKGSRVPFTSVTLQYHVPNEISYHGLTIMVEANPNNLSPIDFGSTMFIEVGQLSAAPEDFASKAGTVMIANTSAIKVVIPPTLTDYTLLLPYKDKMLIISPTGDPMVQDDPVKAQSLEIFDKIISTIVLNP